ncbi:MAG: acyl-ACP--UDP-N-acetylglucosamine O-acyltransferase [Acidobacteriota bacterium]
MANIHPSAVVDPAAELGEGVVIGPHAVLEGEVVLGAETVVGAGAQLRGPMVVGRSNRIHAHATLGFPPQDLKYDGEPTRLEVGDGNVFREFVTVHSGTVHGGGVTRIGSGGLFMVYSHIAHDCVVGDAVIFANGATLAGHVEVGDHVTISAFSAVHQFCRVGHHAYIGGYSVITQDALPYVKTVGQKPAYYGVNAIGLRRKGFNREAIRQLRAAFKVLVESKLNTTQALERLEAEHAGAPNVDYLIDFVRTAKRGIVKTLPGRRGARGASPSVQGDPLPDPGETGSGGEG